MLRFKSFLVESRKKYWNMFYGSKKPVQGDVALAKRLGIEVPVLNWTTNEQTQIKTEIGWAKIALKKEDRVIWWLRWVRLYMLTNTINKEGRREALQFYAAQYNRKTKGEKLKGGLLVIQPVIHLMQHRSNLEHFLDLNIPAINKVIWAWQTPAELVHQFGMAEAEWKKHAGGAVKTKATEFLKIDNRYSWYDLEDNTCREEAEMMGHCSTGPTGTTILSLRERIKKGKQVYYRARLTFIFDRQGNIGESKGQGNKRPSDKYHRYIIPLLKDKRIKGIMGGGYLPHENFSVADLPNDIRDKLIKDKPELMDASAHIRLLKKNYNKDWMAGLLKQTGNERKYNKAKDRVTIWESDWEDFFSQHMEARWRHVLTFMKNMPQSMELWGTVQIDWRSIGGAFSTHQDNFIKQYLHDHHPTWKGDYNEREFVKAFSELEQDVWQNVTNAFMGGHEVGEMEHMIEHMNDILSDLTGGHRYHGSDISLEIDSKFTGDMDAKMKVYAKGKDIVDEVLGEGIDDMDQLADAIFDLNITIKYGDPRGDYGHFDDKYWNDELKEIFKTLA